MGNAHILRNLSGTFLSTIERPLLAFGLLMASWTRAIIRYSGVHFCATRNHAVLRTLELERVCHLARRTYDTY